QADRRPCNDPLLDADPFATALHCCLLVHLSDRVAAFFSARRRLGSHSSGTFLRLCFLFGWISAGQSLGSALAVVHVGTARWRIDNAARADRGFPHGSLLWRLHENIAPRHVYRDRRFDDSDFRWPRATGYRLAANSRRVDSVLR